MKRGSGAIIGRWRNNAGVAVAVEGWSGYYSIWSRYNIISFGNMKQY